MGWLMLYASHSLRLYPYQENYILPMDDVAINIEEISY